MKNNGFRHIQGHLRHVIKEQSLARCNLSRVILSIPKLFCLGRKERSECFGGQQRPVSQPSGRSRAGANKGAWVTVKSDLQIVEQMMD